MNVKPDYEQPLTAEQRAEAVKWVMLSVTIFSLLLFASAFTPNAFVLGPLLSLPGLPLVALLFGHLPYGGVKLLLMAQMAPWLVPGVPVASWCALKPRRGRLFSYVAIAMLVFSVWSATVQIIFLLRFG